MKLLDGSRARIAFGSGVVAMAVAVVLTLGVRVAAGVPTLPELVGDNLVVLIPGNLFELGISLLGPLAKKLLFVILNLGLILAGGGLAILLERANPLAPRSFHQTARAGPRA